MDHFKNAAAYKIWDHMTIFFVFKDLGIQSTQNEKLQMQISAIKRRGETSIRDNLQMEYDIFFNLTGSALF